MITCTMCYDGLRTFTINCDNLPLLTIMYNHWPVCSIVHTYWRLFTVTCDDIRGWDSMSNLKKYYLIIVYALLRFITIVYDLLRFIVVSCAIRARVEHFSSEGSESDGAPPPP